MPPDLHEFVLIDERPSTGDESPFYLGKYPVTNVQYARFLEAEDFADSDLWRGYPKFDHQCVQIEEDWGEAGWQWYLEPVDQYLGEREKHASGVIYPRYWSDSHFGATRRGAPVVGISLYEANAYCQWLLRHWAELSECEANPGLAPDVIRLPTEIEWVAAAGGDQPAERFPWDPPGQVTREVEEITRRSNVSKSEIGRTNPVGMYPMGASQPHALWDLAGNVWEWQANFYDADRDTLALRGGAWYFNHNHARLSGRYWVSPVPQLGRLRVSCAGPAQISF